MKKYLRPKYLPLFVVVAGLLGFFLRLWTLGSGPDKEGLYQSQPVAWVLLWILTAVTLGAILFLTAKLKNPGRYGDNFPASPISAAGTALAALALLVTGIQILTSPAGFLSIISGILGLAAAVCLILTAYARYQGKRPAFLTHAVPCLFFALWIFDRCRDWSNQPQISVFLFPLLASICVMLATYQLASFDVELGRRRHSLFWSLAGVYFCMVSLASTDELMFYGCMAIWLLTNLCSLRMLKVRKPQPEPIPETPEEAEPTPTGEPESSVEEIKDWLDNNQ